MPECDALRSTPGRPYRGGVQILSIIPPEEFQHWMGVADLMRAEVLVLGAGTDKSGPGPLVTQLSRSSGNLPIPITIVPGEMSKERLEAIT